MRVRTEQRREIIKDFLAEERSVAEIAQMLGVSLPTVYAHIRAMVRSGVLEKRVKTSFRVIR